MKVVKRIIVGVLIAALASAGIYTGLMHVKESKVTEVPVTSVSNLMTDWYSETTLDGTITTNVAQNVNMDKDMIIEKIYVSQGDDVKKGDNLISFDMTLVEMELNIAKLKLQKQEQDLTKAQNRLTSLQNGGPIEDSTDSTDDTELNSTDGNTGDSNMTSTDIPSDGSGDDEMQSTTGSLGTAVDGSYLAAASQPLLLSAFTDTASVSEESQEADVIDGEEAAAGETSDGEQLDEDEDSSDDGLIMDPSYQDPAVDDITDGETPDLNAGDDSTPSVSPTPTPTLGPNELPDPNATEEEIPGITDGEPQFYQKLDYTSQPFTGTGTEDDPYVFLVSSAKGKVTVMGSFFNRMAGYSEDGTKVVQKGGSWFQLEFHENDTIADFEDRKLSCTGYYLIDGSLLENPVYMYAETEFTLDDAMKYDDTGDDDEIPDDSGDGDDSTDSTTMTREDAIKIQKNKVSSLKLDIEESNLNITKLENKVKNKLVTSKLDGTVAYIGDEATGSYNGDAFLKVKSKDGFYVTGTVSELMRDQMKEGTLLQCTSYDSGSFEAKVLNVSDYPVDSSNNFYYGGDSNPNVSYYTFNAEITDQSLQFTDQDYVTISLKSNKLSKGSLVVMKAFIRTENGTSYVYKDVKGTLKKQQVTVGSIVNSGYYAIVTSGLKSDDLLAFPYGNTVQEGAKTKEVTLDDMYNE
ncbi:efflux RND transporter periplasmic adaptor subunit [Ruminococcus sp. OM08-9BH]|nr:efflux RND transporter periplasmic adaptor subunit [Ruminococcus sp. OM08-9BH]